MAGGSREQETENDQQCQHCGLWFGSEGVQNHEQHCDLADFETRKVELSCPATLLRAGEVEVGADPDGDRDDRDEVEAESPDDLAADAPSPAPEGATSDPPSASDGMRADGGPMAVPEFEESGPDLADDKSASCPGCDAPADEVGTPELLPDEVLQEHPELRDFDRLCVECSTDDSGNWTSPVEVFDA